MKRRVGLLLVAALLFSACAFVSGVLGFAYGFGYHQSMLGAVEGAYTVSVLRGLRTGDTEGALRLLELKLDGHVIEYTIFRDAPPLLGILDVFDFGRYDTKFLGVIAAYRAEFPHQDPLRGSRDRVSQVVAETLAPYTPVAETTR